MHALAFAAGQGQVAAASQMSGIGSLQRGSDDLIIPDPAALMGQAAHADHFFDPKGEVQGRYLRKHGQALGSQRPGPVAQLAFIEPDIALVSLQLAAQSAEQGAFPGTVRPQYAKDFARFDLERDVGQYDLSTPTDLQILRSQHQARPRSSKYRKNGAPMKAVTIPMGNSAGASANRATRSANNRRLPPASTEAGNSTR